VDYKKQVFERCEFKPGDLVMAGGQLAVNAPSILCLIVGYSPANEFNVDYQDAADHVMFQCEPITIDVPMFVDYACNLKKV
tara:strand:- start:756 stop:998 length:243 start_codon:yes stop_codon:yes gene_type:complete